MKLNKQFVFLILTLTTFLYINHIPTSGVGLGSSAVAMEKKDAPTRPELIDEYMAEFISPSLEKSYPQIYKALVNVLHKLPDDVFLSITDRNRPIIFVTSITSGIAKYANAIEFFVREDDPPMLQEGFFLIILGDELNTAKDVGAIEGVIMHEIAHRWLEHLRDPRGLGCEMEREANQAVKEWGYAAEYEKASDTFGSKKKGDSPCHDKMRSESN